MKRFLAWLLAATLVLPVRAAQLTQEQEKDLQKRYEKAFQYYKAGDYGPALQIWSEILKIDPEQKTAKQMIEESRSRIAEKSRTRRTALWQSISQGRYQKALLDLQLLLDEDPTEALYQTLQARLEKIAQMVPQVPSNSKAWRMASLGLKAELAEKEDPKLAYDGLRYARELAPADEKIERLVEIFESEHVDLSRSDAVTQGMGFMEYKKFVSLNQIYDGKYHLAVGTLQEILALEPNDLVSLKRLGSAYFALGHVAQARSAWRQALKLSPNDKQLKKFLAKRPTRSASKKS